MLFSVASVLALAALGMSGVQAGMEEKIEKVGKLATMVGGTSDGTHRCDVCALLFNRTTSA